jgi:tetratricopeptide (TPR) repeat protein
MNMKVEKILGEAMEKHKAGDINTAEVLYHQILAYNPQDADVLNLLGVLALQRSDLDQAHDLLKRAVEANPGIAEIHNNLGQVLMRQGRSQAAADCFRNCLQINPNLEVARINFQTATSRSIPAQPANAPPMMRYDVVQNVLNGLNGRTYLEIGIDTAESFMNIRAPRKFGIDPVPTFNLINDMLSTLDISRLRYSCSVETGITDLALQAHTRHRVANLEPGETSELFYETSDMFFEKHATALFSRDPINVAFVDGLHTWEQTYQDVLNCLNYLSDNGVILMHDCNPPTAAAAHPAASWEAAGKMGLPGWEGLWCGDVWKAVVQLRAARKDLNIFVLDCDFGIGVVSRGKPEAVPNLSKSQIMAMVFADLDTNRQSLINLKPQDYLYEFLGTIG